MKTLKSILILIVFPSFGFGIAYLLGSFYHATFDISKWPKDTMFGVVSIATVFIIATLIIAIWTLMQNKLITKG